MSVENELTNQTINRLRQVVDGNGLLPDDIQLIEAKEDKYTLQGQIRLIPSCEKQARSFPGAIKVKNQKMLSNFAALTEAVNQHEKNFIESGSWLSAVVDELKAAPGYGWGQDQAKVVLNDEVTVFGASEPCSSCRGAGSVTCNQCQGKKSQLCAFCHGQRQVSCYNCFGRGQDPANPSNPCPICRGTRFALCRQCQGTGIVACSVCQGRGGTSCPSCQGSGKISQEVTVNGGAEVSFSIQVRAGLPSGLLRAMDRVGMANISKGHAVIKMQEQSAEAEDKTLIELTATIPFADIKLRLNGTPVMVSSFGKKGLLFGLPPFLDKLLQAHRDYLARAKNDASMLDKALEARAIKDALKLALGGKSKVEDLRRLYPIGLSAAAAQEIVQNMRNAFRNITRKMRVIAGVLCCGIAAAIFGGLFYTPLYETIIEALPHQIALLVDEVLLLLIMILSWLVIGQSSRWGLQRRFADIKMDRRSGGLGHIGYGTLLAILGVYAAVVLLAPIKPVWLRGWFG